MRRRNNKSNSGLTLDESAFYMLQSIDGTQEIIKECMKSYKEDGNLDWLKVALDGHVQLREMLNKVKGLSSYGHSYDYGP